MRTLFYLLCCTAFTLSAETLAAQALQRDSLPFVSLDDKSVTDLEITRERIFEGPGLYGFMNGGSELFLEYGFQQLLEQRLTYKGLAFIAEYYYMDRPENAYGIYSVHTFKCRRLDERLSLECLTPGLLQFCHHQLYVTLKCMDRTVDPQPLLDELAAYIVNNNPVTNSDKTFEIRNFPAPYSGTLYYVCGDLGLSAAYFDWAEMFVPFSKYAMWLRVDPDTQKASARVSFASEADAMAFCSRDGLPVTAERDGKIVTIQEK